MLSWLLEVNILATSKVITRRGLPIELYVVARLAKWEIIVLYIIHCICISQQTAALPIYPLIVFGGMQQCD